MSIQGAQQLVFGFLPDLPVVLETSAAQLSSDGGLLVIREFDERIEFTKQFAGALQDTRDPLYARHSLLSMVRQRIYGVIADYEDQNDHDELRSDPVFKLIADCHPEGPDLASQPTLSRLENAVTVGDLKRLREVMAQQFLDGFETPPVRITLDVDAFDDPTHGQQQLTFFHGYYDQHQYLPIAFTCAETDHVALVGLRHGTAHPALGADDDLRFLVARIRERWSDVQIIVRGDSGYGVPSMYATCEELGLTYTFGVGMNPRLQRESAELLEQAVQQYEATGQKQRLFMTLPYQALKWPVARQVIVKCEVHAQGTNRRAIVTNRPGSALLPEATYDEYVERGESENRNKELKRGLCADRLSDHRFFANFFRLYLHAAALNLLVRLRRATTKAPTPQSLGINQPLPADALTGISKKQFFNRRRRHDPLGEGQPCTWRSRLIKVAAEVTASSRRILVRFSASWPHFDELFRIGNIAHGTS